MTGDCEGSESTYRRFVALGDSTTEGLEDPYPDGRGFRGWADRLAERLDALAPGLLYANLAIRGRKMRQIRDDQLGPALAMEPDLASVVGGVNDVLRPRVDLPAVLGQLDATAGALRARGATVLMMTYLDPSRIMPFARLVSGRIGVFNDGVREIAARRGAALMDLDRDGVADRRLWHPDRLHANAEGHRLIAAAAADALGLPGADSTWRSPLPPAPRLRAASRAAREAEWTRRHLAPWVMRRLRGRSSGDGLPPKRPTLSELD